jgi:hypothetical protein
LNDAFEGGSLPLAPDSSGPAGQGGQPHPAGSSATPSEPGKFYFTVGQLMEILKDLPQDLPVIVSGQKSGYENFFHPYVAKLIHDPDCYYQYGEFQIYEEKYHNGEETFAAVVLSRVVRDD